MKQTTNHSTSERGYNLIEVLIAIAVLGTILLSIVTLFFFGRRNVYSGKMMTMANSLGTDALEDLSSMTVQGVYDAFLITNATTLGTYTIDTTTYTNAIIRSTNPTVVTNPPAGISAEFVPTGGTGILTAWRNDITTQKKMSGGSVTVIIRPRMPTSVGTANAPAPRVLQMRVIVRWNESVRRRNVVFDTVRYRR